MYFVWVLDCLILLQSSAGNLYMERAFGILNEEDTVDVDSPRVHSNSPDRMILDGIHDTCVLSKSCASK